MSAQVEALWADFTTFPNEPSRFFNARHELSVATIVANRAFWGTCRPENRVWRSEDATGLTHGDIITTLRLIMINYFMSNGTTRGARDDLINICLNMGFAHRTVLNVVGVVRKSAQDAQKGGDS